MKKILLALALIAATAAPAMAQNFANEYCQICQ
jgi:nucleoside-specific outer membrane channel protein Tsx